MKKLMLVASAAFLAATTAYAGWWQTFGGPERDEGTCVQQTEDGGCIVTGFTGSLMWLIKLDFLGHTLWTKTYNEGSGSSAWQTSDGGYAIGGSKLIRTFENGDTMWTRKWVGLTQPTSDGDYIIAAKKSNALWLLKLNETGDSIWARSYPQIGSYADLPIWVEQTPDGGYIITGLTDDVDTEMGVEKTSLFLHRTDSNGNTQWLKVYGGKNWNDLDRGRCVRQTSDGGYIVVGTIIVDGELYSVLRTDVNGDSLWKSIRGGEFYCVEETKDGGFIVTGATEWATLVSSLPANGDLWLVKIDANGDTLWSREYGGGQTDAGRYVQQTSDGGYIVTGYTWSYGAGREDLYMLKTDSLGLLGITEEPILDKPINWKLVTTVGSQVTLRYSNISNGFHASVFDASGQEVSEIHSSNHSGAVTWGKGYSSGVYFIQERETKHTSTAKVVLIR